jgi:hypothetical protein
MDAPVPAAPVVGVAPEMVILFGVGGADAAQHPFTFRGQAGRLSGSS